MNIKLQNTTNLYPPFPLAINDFIDTDGKMCSKSSNSMWLAQILPAILCEGQMLTCATLLQRLNAISQILIAMLREHMVLPYNLRAGT